MGDILRDRDWAEKYYSSEITTFSLQGRLDAVDVAKGPDGKPAVKVRMVPREISPKIIPLQINLAASAAPIASKLKSGDLIEIGSVSFTPTPGASIENVIAGLTGNTIKPMGLDSSATTRRDQIVSWVRSNNGLPSNPNFVKDVMELIDKDLDSGSDFEVRFGTGLMKSRRAMEIGVMDGKVYSLTLSDAQVKEKKIEDKKFYSLRSKIVTTHMPPEGKIESVTLPVSNKWDVSKPLAGKINIRMTRDTDKVPGEYGLRMVIVHDDHRWWMQTFKVAFTKDSSFSFTLPDEEMEAMKTTKDIGNHMVAFELIRVTKKDQGEPLEEIISDPNIVILDISAK